MSRRDRVGPVADEFVVPADFSWVFHAKTWDTGERITLSGQPLLDAFELHRPALSVHSPR